MKDTFKIRLNILSLPEFIRKTGTVKGDVILRQDESIIDGKSFMGVISLNLNKPIEMSINSEDCCAVCARFRKWMN